MAIFFWCAFWGLCRCGTFVRGFMGKGFISKACVCRGDILQVWDCIKGYFF